MTDPADRARGAGVCQSEAVPGVEEEFGELISTLEYPMLIVTAATPNERAGCLVGFSTQASMQPLRFLVFISKVNHTMGVASRASLLVVHFLRDDNHDLAALFGEETGDEVDKFSRCRWQPGPDGTPVLDGVAGWLAGPIRDRFDMGDHVGHLIDVTLARATRIGAQLGAREVGDLTPGHPA